MYLSNRATDVPVRGILHFTPHHVFSMPCVWARLSGSAKLRQWLTFHVHVAHHAWSWQYLRTDNWQECLLMSVPYRKKEAGLASAAKTHCPSMKRPSWNFILPNLDSSISTVVPQRDRLLASHVVHIILSVQTSVPAIVIPLLRWSLHLTRFRALLVL